MFNLKEIWKRWMEEPVHQPVKEKKLVTKVTPTEFEVGWTKVEFTFIDGRLFQRVYYGRVYQNEEYDNFFCRERKCTGYHKPHIHTSYYKVEFIIKDNDNYQRPVSLVIDDDNNPMLGISGQVNQIKIIEQGSHKVMFDVKEMVEEDV